MAWDAVRLGGLLQRHLDSSLGAEVFSWGRVDVDGRAAVQLFNRAVEVVVEGLAVGVGQPGPRYLLSAEARWRFAGRLYALAKGPGYAKFFEGLNPQEWFRLSGAKGLIEQADRQFKKVRGTGIRIEWHVAEPDAAAAIEKLLRGAKLGKIKVVHTPAK